MLSLTTNRHRLFITIPGISGPGGCDFSCYGVLVDNTVDSLHEKCAKDGEVIEALSVATTRDQAYGVIGKHLKAVTPDARWLRTLWGRGHVPASAVPSAP